jgi:hypothetical protein
MGDSEFRPITSDDETALSHPAVAYTGPRYALDPDFREGHWREDTQTTRKFSGITITAIEGKARGDMKFLMWAGRTQGLVVHMSAPMENGIVVTACGEFVPHPDSGITVIDKTAAGIVDCPGCCKLAIKRVWRGA